jgi:hypothetical protein
MRMARRSTQFNLEDRMMSARRAVPFLIVVLAASFLGLGITPSTASAATTCVIASTAPLGNSLVLLNDCTTDEPILVPNQFTFDGDGHTITAVDPIGGHFTGAVIRNATGNSVIHVTNVTIRGQFGADVCDAGELRLRGILFEGAGGTVTNTHLFTVRQGPSSGCQEGNAIEIRNFPEDAMSSSSRTHVTVSDNDVHNYQKTGILVNGNVEAVVIRNVIEGDGPSTVIAQNGVQVGFGATALVSANTISGNNYTPNSFYACGIIVIDADGVDRKQQDNLFPPNTDPMANEKDTCGFAKGGNYEPFGR